MGKLSLLFDIPDTVIEGVKDDFCAYHGYKAMIDDPATPGGQIANPETRTAFFKKILSRFIKESVQAHRINHARELAAKTAKETSDIALVIS